MTTATATHARPTVVAPIRRRDLGAGALHPLLADRFSPRAFDTDGRRHPGAARPAARGRALGAVGVEHPAGALPRRAPGDDAFDALLAALVPGNQGWARDAAALILVAAEIEDAAGDAAPVGGLRRRAGRRAPDGPGRGARPRGAADGRVRRREPAGAARARDARGGPGRVGVPLAPDAVRPTTPRARSAPLPPPARRAAARRGLTPSLSPAKRGRCAHRDTGRPNSR